MKNEKMILAAALAIVVVAGAGFLYQTGRLDPVQDAARSAFGQLAHMADSKPATTKSYRLFARRNLNMGDLIKNPADMFEAKEVAIRGWFPGALYDMDELKGRVLKISRRAGDPIHEEDLLVESDNPGRYRLPEGYRCVGFRIIGTETDPPPPMSRVSVISTYRGEDGNTGCSHRLLDDVLVLAIDGSSPARDENGRAMPAGDIVMFAVSPMDCVRLLSTCKLGVLSLASPYVRGEDLR
jgi:Flp pilus assembly protein CpaB